MTHDELIMKLWEKRNAGCENLDIHFTLSAVVELHKPFQVNDILLCECEPLPYPCPTIQVVEKELV